MTGKLHSAIFEGIVRHCRFTPRRHRFSYRVFMMYLDLDELDAVFSQSPFWSKDRFNLACFRREDYLGDPAMPLAEAVRQRVYEDTGDKIFGPVRMLTNLRYFGYLINPITCYYCFNEEEKLTHIVAEVTNTPWGEKHSYVIPAAQDNARTEASFAKNHHVSPFMPMVMEYAWRSNVPGKNLSVYMENHLQEERVFNAAMHLRQRTVSQVALNGLLLRYPLMTMKVAWGIYWQAMKLWWKKTPFYRHSKRLGHRALENNKNLKVQRK